MINFQELEKVAEFKNGELNWLEGRDINAVYVILVGDEYYIGSSHYTYLRIGQHLNELQKGTHHSEKLQKKFYEIGEFEVYSLDRGIERNKLQFAEKTYIRKYRPTLNTTSTKTLDPKNKIKEVMDERKITSAWLAEKVGISKVAVSNIVTGKNSPSVDNLLKIAEALGVSITYLLGLEEKIEEEKLQESNVLICPKCGAKFELKED